MPHTGQISAARSTRRWHDAQRDDRYSRRLRARSHHARGCGADLPDRGLCLRQRRSWRRALQSRGRGFSLQPHRQSDQRGAGEAYRPARRRRRRARGCDRPGCAAFRLRQRRRSRRQHRFRAAALRHHAHAALAHPAAAGHHRPFRRERQAGCDRKTDRREHARRVRRDHRQSCRQRLRHRGARQDRACAWRAADRGQHGRDPDPAQAVRLRRRHRRAFAHQVSGRPRHHAGRGHRRFRKLPLGQARGPLPGLQQARRLLSRPRLCRALRQDRLYRARPQRLSAHHGFGAVAVQRFPAAPGHRDRRAAHGTPCRERPQSRRIPAQGLARCLGQLHRLSGQPLLPARSEIPRR
ncbi:hypothetical protein ACVIU4_010004 [Bradyrhizobium barranii subsp. barranii]